MDVIFAIMSIFCYTYISHKGNETEIEVRMENKELIQEAFAARKMAYTPYSHFQVGAALLSKDGQVFQGCNIENASYGVSNCAERTALFKAVSEGVRDFAKIVIVGGPETAESFNFCEPCGICRQALAEFCDVESFTVILARSEDDYQEFRLKDLLPHAFLPEHLHQTELKR